MTWELQLIPGEGDNLYRKHSISNVKKVGNSERNERPLFGQETFDIVFFERAPRCLLIFVLKDARLFEGGAISIKCTRTLFFDFRN